jgi:hypothetical protein
MSVRGVATILALGVAGCGLVLSLPERLDYGAVPDAGIAPQEEGQYLTPCEDCVFTRGDGRASMGSDKAETAFKLRNWRWSKNPPMDQSESQGFRCARDGS